MKIVISKMKSGKAAGPSVVEMIMATGGSSRQLTPKKGAPGDQVLDLLCVQLAITWKRAH